MIADLIKPAPRDVWAHVAASDPYALVTQTPGWMDTMTESGGWIDASRAYRLDSGRQLVLPMARRRAPNELGPQSSFAEGWGMGGVLAPGGPTVSDAAAILADLSSSTSIRTSVRPNPLLAAAWAAPNVEGVMAIPKRAHVLELAGGADVVWQERFTQSGRRGVRRAERADVQVTRDSDGMLIPVFYDLFMKSLARWAERSKEPVWMAQARGRRRDPLKKFETMARRLGDAFHLYIAYHDGVPAAAILVLMGTNAHYTRGAMDVDIAGPTNANDLLHWTAIQAACAAGCASYHMGESGTSGSLSRYKEKLGASPFDYSVYRTERLPLTAADRVVRGAVKRVIGFRDPDPAKE